MEYLIEFRLEDNNYNALVHFVATMIVNSHEEADSFHEQLKSSFLRNKVQILNSTFMRIDHDLILKRRQYEYCNFCRRRATASIEIEQFKLEDPDQAKSLSDNLVEKLFKGENSTAIIGKKYDIPVRVTDKDSRNPITDDFFYFSIEHLIPKER